jgi:hypothetical protein
MNISSIVCPQLPQSVELQITPLFSSKSAILTPARFWPDILYVTPIIVFLGHMGLWKIQNSVVSVAKKHKWCFLLCWTSQMHVFQKYFHVLLVYETWFCEIYKSQWHIAKIT